MYVRYVLYTFSKVNRNTYVQTSTEYIPRSNIETWEFETAEKTKHYQSTVLGRYRGKLPTCNESLSQSYASS